MAIRIITDTSSDFDPQMLRRQGIGLVSMTINAGGKSYADGVDLARTDFYDMLLSDTLVPKTSQPSPQDFLDLFEQTRANGDDAIAILISSALSGTVQSASTAKELCGGDGIYIVDSLCATAGIQYMVQDARRMADAGADAPSIVAHLESLRSRIRVFLGLDTLKYLYRGGRLSRVEAGIGTLTGVRPLLALTRQGTLEVCAKCIGGKKALKRLTEIIQSVPADPAYRMRFIYSYDAANCQALMQSFPNAQAEDMLEIGPTLATHAGPGVYGAVFVAAESSQI